MELDELRNWTDPAVLARSVGRVLRDLQGLILVQGILLAITFLFTDADIGDVRVQLAWLTFLIPGWLLASSWTAHRSAPAIRYTHAVIGSLGIHGWLASIGSFGNLGFNAYLIAFVGLTMALLVLRAGFLLRTPSNPRSRIPPIETIVWVSVMLVVVAVYRQPRSADVIQFSLQQQDMAAARSLQPSTIGMSALGVQEAMPRWRSHLWHLLPSLIADVTFLPVDGVLWRWAPIPVGFSTLVVLITVVGRLAGRRVPLWAIVLAVLGPVLLWYRAYHAFNYSFRLTNSFCLDKDLCLFLLVPATIYLATRWIRGVPRTVPLLMLLVPSILKFHPMTAIYLVLLTPFVVIGYDPSWRGQNTYLIGPTGNASRSKLVRYLPGRSALVWSLVAAMLFAAMVVIGDAQTAHEQITEITKIDWHDYQMGRPLHYWVGQYTSIPNHGLTLDTSQWTSGRLWLRWQLLMNCELLGGLHLAWIVWLVESMRIPTQTARRQRCWAVGSVLALLWGIWLASPWLLTWKPHYLAGYERLHWFAYVPALMALAVAFVIVHDTVLTWLVRSYQGDRVRLHRTRSLLSWCAASCVGLLLSYSAITFLRQRPSVWSRVPYLNSLLDFELPAQVERVQSFDPLDAKRDLESRRPEYLRAEDRVLFLDHRGNDQYWLIKQGTYWCELYAEAYAWKTRGDDFLDDRRLFYNLLDRQPGLADGVREWLDAENVTLVVDRRPDGDVFLQQLNAEGQLGMQRIAPGVWRIPRSAP